jgi:hypothetical protein
MSETNPQRRPRIKTIPIPVRFDPWIPDELKKISTLSGLDRSDVLRQLVAAGTRAIVENDYHWDDFPLRFEVGKKDLKP